MIITVLYVGSALLAFYLVRRMLSYRFELPLPPGPQGLPFVGNVFDIPREREYEAFTAWKEKYGDIVSVTIFGHTIIVLNSAKHAFNILDHRSGNYSDRPFLWMGGELVGWNKLLGSIPYGDRFRSLRRLVHTMMGTPAIIANHPAKILPLVELEIHRFLKHIAHDTSDLPGIIRFTAGKIIVRLSYGYQVKDRHDPILECAEKARKEFSLACQLGAWFVDLVPLLRYIPAWVPGAGFQKQAAVWRATRMQMIDRPHDFVKEQMAAGTAKPSFTLQHLEKEDLSAEEEDLVKCAVTSLLAGGVDTTVSVLSVFFLAMVLYPDVQAKAQQEIDLVIGPDRLPTFSDRKDLPYVEALMTEVFRWQALAPLGVPHRVVEEDIYEGYRIPRGALVVFNVWQLLHDPEEYSDPLTFNPDRFIGPNPARDPKDVAFGFGMRACPGRHLASESTWLACVSVLAVFNVRHIPGQELPKPVMTDKTPSNPEPFQCKITPRSEHAQSLFMSAEELDEI